MIHKTLLGLALACAGAFSSAAEPLPQGHFMAAPYLDDDTLLPRYIAIAVDGSNLDLSFFSQITMDFEACASRQVCDHRLLAATADAELEDGRLILKDVSIETDIGIDAPRFGPPHLRYTVPVMDGMQGAVFRETDMGFDLDFGDETLSFFRAAIDVQDAIAVFPVAMGLSIRNLGGCEVAALAPLFDQPNPSGAQSLFRSALLGFVLQSDLAHQTEALGDVYALDHEDPRMLEYRSLQRTAMVPQFLSATTAPDAGYSDRITQLLENGAGPGFEPDDVAFFGAYLPAMVALFDHLQSGPEISAAAACADPSFGFMDAQGG